MPFIQPCKLIFPRCTWNVYLCIATALTPNLPNSLRFHFYYAPLVIEMRSFCVFPKNNGCWMVREEMAKEEILLALVFHNYLQTQMGHFMSASELSCRAEVKILIRNCPKMAEIANDFRTNCIPLEKFSLQLYYSFIAHFSRFLWNRQALCEALYVVTEQKKPCISQYLRFFHELTRTQKSSWCIYYTLSWCEKSSSFTLQITHMLHRM